MNQKRNDKDFPYLEVHEYFKFPRIQDDSDCIIATGGNLSPGMLYSAYLQGIFPWFNEDDPLYWWSPDPRFVIFPEDFHIPSRLKRFILHSPFTYTCDTVFDSVITSCAQKCHNRPDTWIQEDVIAAYNKLHKAGVAHSVETWLCGKLVGGFYGVSLGNIFFGESMFSLANDASKSAFCIFSDQFFSAGGKLIDSQIYTDHIARFGGKNISRQAFLQLETHYLKNPQVVPFDFPINLTH